MAPFTSMLSFFAIALMLQVNAAPLEVRTPQNTGFNSGECQNAQRNAGFVLPEAVRAINIIATEVPKGSNLSKALTATATALNGAIPGLNRIQASVNKGVQTSIDDLNSLNAGLANALDAFKGVKGGASVDEDIASAKDILGQAVDAGNLVTRTCL